jgi:hypothetical protein
MLHREQERIVVAGQGGQILNQSHNPAFSPTGEKLADCQAELRRGMRRGSVIHQDGVDLFYKTIFGLKKSA